ncbi:MAG TPA: P22 phage major capsid protein family protein [Acidocella sp.]|nr:P22 phage major capsid protein family protein [Acidocella sp.]
MAVSNTLTSVIPTLYAQGLSALRSNLVMPGLVLNDFGSEVKEKGEIIQVPLPSVMSTTAVVPAAYAPDPQNIGPTTATIPLDTWQESAFTLTEKEYAQVIAGVVPIQLTAAIQALAYAVNASIFNNYIYVGNSTGTAGTTPFATTVAAATNAGVILDNQLAPIQDRVLVLNPTAYGQAEQLPNFAYALYSGDTNTVNKGVIKQKFGFDWHKDQQIPTQVAGTLTGTVTANATQAAGLTAIAVTTAASSSFAPNVGDIVTFAGDSQTYTVLAGGVATTPLGASASGTLNIYPAKVVAIGGSPVALTLTASHVVNLAFQKQAFAFASRPVAPQMGKDPNMHMMVPDPVSGLTMSLEIREEFHRTRVAYSMLWGTSVVRPNLACRIFG